jgi:cell division protein FtsB
MKFRLLLKKIITNKYWITAMVFIAYLFFGDKNNILEQYELQQQYLKVKRENAYYKEQIKQSERQYTELFTNKQNLETFAREKYLMKRENEDVFVIVNATESASE